MTGKIIFVSQSRPLNVSPSNLSDVVLSLYRSGHVIKGSDVPAPCSRALSILLLHGQLGIQVGQNRHFHTCICVIEIPALTNFIFGFWVNYERSCPRVKMWVSSPSDS